MNFIRKLKFQWKCKTNTIGIDNLTPGKNKWKWIWTTSISRRKLLLLGISCSSSTRVGTLPFAMLVLILCVRRPCCSTSVTWDDKFLSRGGYHGWSFASQNSLFQQMGDFCFSVITHPLVRPSHNSSSKQYIMKLLEKTTPLAFTCMISVRILRESTMSKSDFNITEAVWEMMCMFLLWRLRKMTWHILQSFWANSDKLQASTQHYFRKQLIVNRWNFET